MTTLFKKIVLVLTLKCDKAEWLMSESLDRRLLLHERLALRGHLIACRVCPLVKQQLNWIRQASTRTEATNTTLSNEAKQRFKGAIRKAKSS